MPRKANDPLERLLPSNTKTASLTRLQVLISENLNLIASSSILLLHIINKALGDRQEKGTTGRFQVKQTHSLFLLQRCSPRVEPSFGFVKEKPTMDRPEECP